MLTPSAGKQLSFVRSGFKSGYSPHSDFAVVNQMPTSCRDVYPRANGTHLIRPAEEVWKVEVDCEFTGAAGGGEGWFLNSITCLKDFKVVSKRLHHFKHQSAVIAGFFFPSQPFPNSIRV